MQHPNFAIVNNIRWFMQDLPIELSELWLAKREPSYFLVRISVSSCRTPFTISTPDGHRRLHNLFELTDKCRVHRLSFDTTVKSRYRLDHPPLEAPTLVELITQMPSLKTPCPRNRDPTVKKYLT